MDQKELDLSVHPGLCSHISHTSQSGLTLEVTPWATRSGLWSQYEGKGASPRRPSDVNGNRTE